MSRRGPGANQGKKLGQHAVLPLPRAAKPRAVSGRRLADGSDKEK